MERQVNKTNFALLERLSKEDGEINGWRGAAVEWMWGYERYFDEDVDEEHDDLPVDDEDGDEDDDDDDEGIVDDAPFATCTRVSAVRLWMKMFCVVQSGINVKTRALYSLCTKCYASYVELYPPGFGIYHDHIMRHRTYPTLDDAFTQLNWKCSSCLTSLSQIIPREICHCCNTS